MHARDQSFILSIGRKFRPDYGLLLELHVHALTLVARSYALLHPDGWLSRKREYTKTHTSFCHLDCDSSGTILQPKTNYL